MHKLSAGAIKAAASPTNNNTAGGGAAAGLRCRWMGCGGDALPGRVAGVNFRKQGLLFILCWELREQQTGMGVKIEGSRQVAPSWAGRQLRGLGAAQPCSTLPLSSCARTRAAARKLITLCLTLSPAARTALCALRSAPRPAPLNTSMHLRYPFQCRMQERAHARSHICYCALHSAQVPAVLSTVLMLAAGSVPTLELLPVPAATLKLLISIAQE